MAPDQQEHCPTPDRAGERMTVAWFEKMKADLSREDPNYPSLKARYVATWVAALLGLMIAIGAWFATEWPMLTRTVASFAGVLGLAVGLSVGLLLKRAIGRKSQNGGHS